MTDSELKKIKELPIVGKQPNTSKEEEYLREMAEYEFINTECPGVMMKFSYGNSSKNHRFTFMHGGKYIVPRFLARHIESRATPIWDWKPDGEGKMVKKLMSYKPRFQMRQVY